MSTNACLFGVINALLMTQSSQCLTFRRSLDEINSVSSISNVNSINSNNNIVSSYSSEDTNIPSAVSSTSQEEVVLDPIVAKGYKFFNSRTKENVLIKGVDYYPRPNAGKLDMNSVDFFTEEYRHIWERDIPQFQALGLNAIRLYSVDATKDHSAFMCALNKAGIYVLVELASGSCAKCAILSKKAPHCYPSELKIRGELIIREFSKYTNTLAFSAGNEVNHFVPLGKPPQWNAPCLKKFVKDMRAYMARCEHIRNVPVGLIMADSDRDENTLYYNCESDGDDGHLEHADWYGINTYVYCNGTANSFDEAKGFDLLLQSFESYNYSIPVLLTEYGCLSSTFPTIDGYEGQRNFNQAKWLGLKNVQNNFAGGFAFEYSIEADNARTPFPYKELGKQNYGIGYLSPENCDDINIKCEYIRTPSFYNLKKAYALARPENITMDDFKPSKYRTGRTTCPAEFPKVNSFHWPTDWMISVPCPSIGHETWTCPTGYHVISHGMNGKHFLFVAALLLLILYLILRYFHTKSTLHALSFDVCNVSIETKSQSTSDDETNGLVDSNHKKGGYLSVASTSDSDQYY